MKHFFYYAVAQSCKVSGLGTIKNTLHSLLKLSFLLLLFVYSGKVKAQNSMVGDGFGGNAGYTPVNYTVGSYTGYANCGGTLKGWGGNNYYQLGNGTITGSIAPVDVLTNVKYYSTGYGMGVIKDDNSLWIWGSVSGSFAFATTPVQADVNVKFFDAGQSHSAYVKNDGTAWVIGRDGIYQTVSTGTTPNQVLGISNCVRVAAGGSYISSTSPTFTVFLLSDGTVKYIGGTDTNSLNPVGGTLTTISSLTNIVDIKANSNALYALKADGTVWAMGFNGAGALGNGTTTNSQSVPVQVQIPNGVSIKAISACNDGYHAMALSTTGDVYSWGQNAKGQVVGTAATVLTPTLVASNARDIMAGETFSYIVKMDYTLWAIGSSLASQGSIWMNLTNIKRTAYTQIDPNSSAMNLCSVVLATCKVGANAPVLSATPQAIVCPDTTVNLTTITASNLPASTTLTWHTGTPATTANKILGTAVTAGTYYAAFFDAVSDCYSPTTAVTPTVVSCVTGTIDCGKTQISTIPEVGTIGQKSLMVTINVTQAGCFTPLSVSGSGMSLANGANSVCTTTTGIRQYIIPVKYDGTALGTLTFTVGSAGSCSTDLSSLTGKKKVVTDVWTLENCSLIQVGPGVK